MNKEKNKFCQNCKKEFQIKPEDFKFYQKMEVPEPTFCPECRAQRRMMFDNHTNVYKKKDELTGNKIFSEFAPESNIKIYDKDYWWSDNWDPLEYGYEYDFEKNFFEQLNELSLNVPRPSRSVFKLINSDYSAASSYLKNCYFLFNSAKSEDCAYGLAVNNSKDSFDNSYLESCELCNECFMLNNCYQALCSSYCDDCRDVLFCKNCIGCSNCFGCIDLKHKQYYIFNKSYSKKEYEKIVADFKTGSFDKINDIINKTGEHFLNYPHKFMVGRKNENVTGEYIYNCKKVLDSYLVQGSEYCKYCQDLRGYVPGGKDCYDYTLWGDNAELVYEGSACGNGVYNIKFSHVIFPSCRNLEYCIDCHASSNLFACVGLRHKQYCILNKQYTKEEYEKLVPRIKQHMNDMPYTDSQENEYKYGEFFPPELSPFAYNETIAQEYFPLTEQQAKEKGYSWHKKEKPNYQPTLKAKDIPDNIKDIDESIQKEIIECANEEKGYCQSSGVFRIIPQEYNFLKQQNLPIPRLCPDCRHQERIKQRNPIKLYQRQCMCNGKHDKTNTYTNQNSENHQSHKPDEQCPNTFQTSYSPDRKEIVYCEECYQREVE